MKIDLDAPTMRPSNLPRESLREKHSKPRSFWIGQIHDVFGTVTWFDGTSPFVLKPSLLLPSRLVIVLSTDQIIAADPVSPGIILTFGLVP